MHKTFHYFFQKKNQLLLLLFVSPFLIFAQNETKEAHEWVLFGEHTTKVHYNIEEEYHIHIDKNGDFYPDQFISDDDIRDKGNNQLRVWAKEYPKDFSKIAMTYHLNDTLYSALTYNILQDSIVANIARNINYYARNKSQTWLVHGFRKNLYQVQKGNIDSTSLADNKIVKNHINNYLNKRSKETPYYVEVYWDGKYMFLNLKTPIKIAKMFKHAIPDAKNAGYALRDVMQQIKCQNINILTHSTGTYVGANLLFNISDDFNYIKPTPTQHINLVLVASASAGKKLFKNFYQRITEFDYKTKDNYTIINAFNKKDVVLKINLLYPARASTKLGCNFMNESGKLTKYFSKNFTSSTFIQKRIKYKGVSPHFFYHYVGHPTFQNVFELIY